MRIDEALRRRSQGERADEDPALREKRREPFRAGEGRGAADRACRPGPCGNRESEAGEDIGHRRADRAEPHDADREIALRGRRRPAPEGVALLLLQCRQAAIMPQGHQRHVLRHAHALLRIDGAHQGDIGGQVGSRNQIVGAGAGAGDEAERGKTRRNARREPERENRFDLRRGRRGGIGMDRFLDRQRAQRVELTQDERRSGQHEDRHGMGRERRRLSVLPVKC